MKSINTEKAPGAIGPYTQGKISDGLVFTSGQIGLVPETGELIEGGIEAQTRQVCENIKAILEEAGTDLTKVVKTLCFLKDINDFGVFNGIYAEYFTEKPARSCVGGASLPKGALVEIEVIAEA